MVQSDRQLVVRELEGEDDGEFALWLFELTHDYPDAEYGTLDEHFLVLSSEIGDWIGGLRYLLRGGVAQILELGVAPTERGQGHALRLLQGFEAAAAERGAHLLEFWTPNLDMEPLLAVAGWRLVLARPGYIERGTWYLLERALEAETVTGTPESAD